MLKVCKNYSKIVLSEQMFVTPQEAVKQDDERPIHTEDHSAVGTVQ
jgi:hypothetical protein